MAKFQWSKIVLTPVIGTDIEEACQDAIDFRGAHDSLTDIYVDFNEKMVPIRVNRWEKGVKITELYSSWSAAEWYKGKK